MAADCSEAALSLTKEKPKPPEGMTPEEKIDLLYKAACIGVKQYLMELGDDLDDPDIVEIKHPQDDGHGKA